MASRTAMPNALTARSANRPTPARPRNDLEPGVADGRGAIWMLVGSAVPSVAISVGSPVGVSVSVSTAVGASVSVGTLVQVRVGITRVGLGGMGVAVGVAVQDCAVCVAATTVAVAGINVGVMLGVTGVHVEVGGIAVGVAVATFT